MHSLTGWYASGRPRTTEVIVMSDSERRQTVVHSDELRRQLRERDEECYRLRVALDALPQESRSGPMARPLLAAALVAFAVLGMGGGAVLWNRCAGLPRAADSQVTLALRPVDAAIVTDARAYPTAIDLPTALPSTPSPSTPSLFPGGAQDATAIRRPAVRRPQPRSTRLLTQPHVARSRPRPLSPGEFGRPTGSRRSLPRAD
jgi:hypothetical protein